MDKEIKQALMLENYENPFHKKEITDDNYIKINTNSQSCIDNIDIYLKIENDVIVDAWFDGEACVISTSAISLMLKRIIGDSIDNIKELIKNYQNMINEEPYDEELLQELNAYDEIYLKPNRKGCALLPSVAILKAIAKYEGD